MLALFNTKVTQRFLNIFNPSIFLQVRDFEKLPIIFSVAREQIEDLSRRCVEIAKTDWDSHEFSLEFMSHPIINNGNSLEKAYSLYANKVDSDINEALMNEEKLNRLFSKEYSIEDYIDKNQGNLL